MHPHLTNRVRATLRLRHIELMDVLGETLNIHHAAPRLNLSQPATSKLLREVEELYQARLFERLPRGLRATAAGEAVIRWARLLLHQMGESLAEAHMVAAGATGRVRVGVLPVVIPTLVAEILRCVRAEMPGLVVTLTEGGNDILLPGLLRNEIDVVLGRLSADTANAPYVTEPLYDEPARLVVRREHPLLRKRSLSVLDLADAQWILPSELASMRQQLDRVLVMQGLPPSTPRIETTSQMLVEIVLNQTDMVAAMPCRVAQLHAARGQLAILDLPLPISMPPVGIVLHSQSLHSPAVESFISLVRRAATQLAPAADRQG